VKSGLLTESTPLQLTERGEHSPQVPDVKILRGLEIARLAAVFAIEP
jgi:hypothetical protein